MNFYEACAFIDAWGQKPDEWFVCECDYRAGEYGLSHDMAGPVQRYATAAELSYPEEAQKEIGDRFYVGDLVRVAVPTPAHPPSCECLSCGGYFA